MLPGLYQRMAHRLTRVMGEPVVFALAAGSQRAAIAHYRAPWEGRDSNGIPVENLTHILDIATAELPVGVREGQTVNVRGQALRISEISHDDGGMTRILAAGVRA